MYACRNDFVELCYILQFIYVGKTQPGVLLSSKKFKFLYSTRLSLRTSQFYSDVIHYQTALSSLLINRA